MIVLDGREALDTNDTWNSEEKPAIMLTGAHHSRELVSIQMPLFSVLRLLHGVLHKKQRYLNLVMQNRYYIVPIVNVDGVALITDHWNQNNEILMKRKNMNPNYLSMCDKANGGVDLNRNYGKYWGKPGGSSTHPCDESFEGD